MILDSREQKHGECFYCVVLVLLPLVAVFRGTSSELLSADLWSFWSSDVFEDLSIKCSGRCVQSGRWLRLPWCLWAGQHAMIFACTSKTHSESGELPIVEPLLTSSQNPFTAEWQLSRNMLSRRAFLAKSCWPQSKQAWLSLREGRLGYVKSSKLKSAWLNASITMTTFQSLPPLGHQTRPDPSVRMSWNLWLCLHGPVTWFILVQTSCT